MRANGTRWGVARGRAAALLLAALAATACTTATHKRFEMLDDDWRRQEASAAPATAAGRGADADERLFERVAFLERGELVRQVLARNPSVRAARQAWRAALARYPQVTALDDPMLGLGIAPLSIGSRSVDTAPKFDFSQKLPFPGKLGLRGAVAVGEAEAAAHDYAAVRLRLASMASLLYDDYVLAHRALAINAQHVALLEEFKHIATARYEVGEASQQDPIQAEVELTHALHREIVLETDRRVTAEQINALLRRAPDAELPPLPEREDAPPAVAPPADQLVAQALAERPEVAAASARVEAQKARVDLALREYFPDFTLVGSYNQVMQQRDLQPFVGLQLNVPLQLGRRRAALDEAEARLEEARSQQVAVEDDVRFAAQSGVERLAEAQHVAQLYRDGLIPASEDQVAAARSGFETGRNSFLALIDAERNLLGVELGHATALADLGRRRTELDRALGRIPGLDW